MPIIRWLLKTDDRIGMIQEVTQVFSLKGVSIRSMEVSTGQIFIKFSLDGPPDGKNSIEEGLKQELLQHQDVQSIVTIPLQPHEQREKELQAVLEFTNEGIIGLSSEGAIRYINSAAAQLLRIDKDKVIGSPISCFTGPNTLFDELLTGKAFEHQQMFIPTPRGTLHYLCTGRPIQDENEHFVGAVATLKSMKSAKQLANSIMHNTKFEFRDIVYVSPSMKELIQIAQRVATTNCSILIRGERGNGQEKFTQAIHQASSRRLHPFVPINCAALPEALLESELFGYEDGAFSGARKGGKAGLFAAAHQGTLFLDEISELPLPLQGKLLRVLQEGVFRPLGGNRDVAVDVRILAATNRNLEEMVVAKQFRQDLYYRITVIPLQIPPLRQRPEDIPILLRHFHIKYGTELNRQLEFSPAALDALLQYGWPGNVRELQNVVLRAFHLTSGKEINIENLLLTPDWENSAFHTKTSKKSLKQVIGNTEKFHLEQALRKHGTARGAAREIGISHTAVLTKIRRYDLAYLLNKDSSLR